MPPLPQCARRPPEDLLPAPVADRLAGWLKAVADPARLRLLYLIKGSEDGEACVGELVGPLGLSQPTVSHHLKVLYDAALVMRDRRGAWTYYRLAPGVLDVLQTLLVSVGCPASSEQPVRIGRAG